MKKIIQFKPKNISWSSILIQILDINIQAINKTLEEGNINKNWGDMLHYGVSEKYIREIANDIIDRYDKTKDLLLNKKFEKIDKVFINIPSMWYNTLKSTLYYMEEDLINKDSYGVYDLWNFFFNVDIQRNDNLFKPLKLYSYDKKDRN
jgi:hypothetical protein